MSDTKEVNVLETLMYVLLACVEVSILLNEHDHRYGGPGLKARFEHLRDSIIKPWHYPERWRKAKADIVIEANIVKMKAAGEL